MSGWHMRFWRRLRVAPGMTVNLSKAGPSVSVGPRGAKMTFGPRGTRQTIGLPGTGLYATRQLSNAEPAAAAAMPAAPMPLAQAGPLSGWPAPSAPEAASELRELHFGWPLSIAVLLGVMIYAAGQPAELGIAAASLAFVVGLGYEWLAHHHPRIAKVLLQIAIALAAVAAIAVTIFVVFAAGILMAGVQSQRRR